ncbi:helix-turn-helix domain-containing protein [Cellulomonas sp. Y8]|uniref:helix-turn-helix domain-containing protein n=1 Tax=Cellulomonas sp. Y8 TaxID=2591145 RepID=UPI0011C81340|nr:helix-turn-helix transcriptional regulator [Cellulomonas sp. Y8]
MHNPEQQPAWQRDFGSRLQQLRTESALTQEQLASASGLDRTYIAGVERGRRNPTLVTIRRLAMTLDISPADFFERP